ncbi:MAG: hypothetical protein LC725_00900 [Lentisphaerae bacterium]|nr:hypothetical protein [Lentisphaerota bacterium]
MRVSLNWLKELAPTTATTDELAEKLTSAGLEIEEIIRGPALPHVVAARVLEVLPHPGADRLRLVRVETGSGAVPVVCGADNFKPGDMVPLAQPGAVLADGRVIKQAVLRGETSEGMLCAADELGIDQDHQGLLILPPDSLPGSPIAAIIGDPDDILVIEVTPNRPDCLSMLGIAREAAALYGVPLQWPRLPEPSDTGSESSGLQVEVESQDDCPRYIARELRHAGMRATPACLRPPTTAGRPDHRPPGARG